MTQKTLIELMEENISKIPIYTDEWTNFNPSDPGITILENLAGIQIIQQNRMDEVTDDVKVKLLKLLGYIPKKGKGARVYLEPLHVNKRFSLMADQRFMVGDICYETNKTVEIADSHIIGAYVQVDNQYKDVSFILDHNVGLLAKVFGKNPKIGNSFYLVMDKPLKEGEKGILHIDVANDYNRNPFSEEQKGIFAQIKWECYCQDGFVEMEVDDNTADFLVDGEIILQQPQVPAKLYENEEIRGYVWRATLEKAAYDVAPVVAHITGFLFPVVQKETLAITYNFQKSTDICVTCNLLEKGYVTVFAKEQKGSSYRKYEEFIEANYTNSTKGRFYRKSKNGHGEVTFSFDKEAFGYAPIQSKVQSRNSVKVVIYNEEIMKKFYLGDVYGYDNQEIKLPVKHIMTETFCLIARRVDANGEYIYDFLRPNKMDEKKMSYYLFENEGKIVIQDAGDYIGASLFMGSVAVEAGEDGNVRKGNIFICEDLEEQVVFKNPANGKGGRFQETLEQVRQRFITDMNTPSTAVLEQDYEELVAKIPGLCIAKARAWKDVARNEVQIAVMPKLEQEFPKMSEVYQQEIEAYLDKKRLLATSIRILQPQYVSVQVGGKIYVKPQYRNCEEQIYGALYKELDYIHGKQRFGETLKFERVFHALDALECVACVYDLKITSMNPEYVKIEGADLCPANHCLLYPGKIEIEVIPEINE